jgi:pyruvate dehydrogenase E2 component (dihydrolipoamide acetyltransferase)
MPKFGLTMESGFIEKWFKKEGDMVKEGEPLLEVSSEKITNEVASPVSGILLKIIFQEQEEIKVGTVIALIGEEGEKLKEYQAKEEPKKSVVELEKEEISSTKIASPDTDRGRRRKASPLARKIAQEKNLDLSRIKGTGPDGRIEKCDILNFLSFASKEEELNIEKLSGLRRTIMERLSKSFHDAITLTNVTEIDFTELKKISKEQKVSVTSGLIFILARVLKELNKFNAHFNTEKKEYILFKNINIGIAVDSDKGLMVPVIREADKLKLKTINEQLKELVDKSRSGAISERDIKDSTFTITNLGMMRTDFFTPILNPPEVAILGVGRILKKPCIMEDDKIAIREMAYLSLSYDHRVIDGADAARFLDKIAQYIEIPNLE